MKLEQIKVSALGQAFHFHEYSEFRVPLRLKLDKFLVVIAGNGQGSPYLKSQFQDATGEVVPLICFLDDESELKAKTQRRVFEAVPLIEIEGLLFDWVIECGVTLSQCKLVQPV
ncbi:MAG: hypothetical protein EBS05_02560 [Proteobacteria bacterium]|nr:hypothetical protein [Pseudomonadota bacterium]